MNSAVEALGTARTPAEAHIYMDIHPHSCGSAKFDRVSAVISLNGELHSRYRGTCDGCGADREFLFRLPDQPSTTDRAAHFGGGRSELLDPGEWLFIADRYATHAPAQPSADPKQRARDERTLLVAIEAMNQLRAFLDQRTGRIADEWLKSEHSARYLRESPSSFDEPVIISIERAYRQLLSAFDEAQNT